ncbi:neutral/alkaline non-lysosomal ceramidase N-terminal domain-containing protein [uncultured Gimesia sp.]|uniref:neutral/alkaline non-lysosomal ceramidase N-terminal domain-containing protein n=1 Tax=uncultured Gimesia sp. TaxID=1678688 RepID=UPI00261A5686|nr:neutral/alkaline non-lysosomal ceramidase N-terminal domain-containing protein [uncultured Gimesia sp.]
MRPLLLSKSVLISFSFFLVVLPQSAYCEFLAGAFSVDISPEKLPAIQNGGFLERSQNQVLDRLHARCFVLKSGEEVVAIAVVDSCMIPRDICYRAKVLVRKQTGIPVNRILIASTHTHTAPSVMNLCLGTNSDPSYERFLPGKLAEGIANAYANLEPARMGVAVVDAPKHTHCRRWLKHPDKYANDPFGEKTVRAIMHPGYQNAEFIGPAGPVDTGLSLFSIQSADGKRSIGLIANYSMHYFGTRGGFSADYYGKFSSLMENKIATTDSAKAPFVAAMSQGTSGDLQWMNYGQPRKKDYSIDVYSAELAEIAFNAYQKIQYETGEPKLAMAETMLVFNRRLPSKERVSWANELNTKRGDRRPKSRPEVYAEQVAWFVEYPQEEIILQVLRVGDLAITAIPNEVYGITGLKLKAQSPFKATFNMGLANGAAGYIPPPEQHFLGGYTTWPARTAGLETDAEPKIVDSLLGLMEKLSGQKRKPLTVDFYNDQQRKAIKQAKADDNNRANRGLKD